MSKYRILIVEDEVIILETIASMLIELGYEIAGKEKTEQEALDAIYTLEYDLALVDINLESGIEGINIGEKLGDLKKPFIYLTSYSDDFTLERAKKTLPGSYIVKPFNKNDLRSNIEIVLARERIVEDTSGKHKIQLLDGYKTVVIYIEDILWIKSEGVYLEIQTVERKLLQRTSFDEFMPKLSESNICRVHRSWAINPDYIQELSSTRVKVNYQEIPISKSYRNVIQEALSANK